MELFFAKIVKILGILPMCVQLGCVIFEYANKIHLLAKVMMP